MRAAKKGISAQLMFFLSVLFFALCLGLGMIAAYHMEDELYGELCEYLKTIFNEKKDFKEVFLSAVKSDFRYTFFVLVLSFGTISSFLSIIFVGFKGFCSGLTVGLASCVLKSFFEIFVFSSAVFLSCVFKVPLYVLMFMMCFKFAKRIKNSTEPFGAKLKAYAEFFLAVMFLFAVLCTASCLEAVISLMFVG